MGIPIPESQAVILLSASLADPVSTLHFIERRLLLAGAIGLLFALVVGYGLASMHARRIRRLERAAERIAGGQFDEPVVDRGLDELGELAAAFERMRVRLEKLDRARSEFIANASHELRTPLFSLGASSSSWPTRSWTTRRGPSSWPRCGSRSNGSPSSQPTCSTSRASTPAGCASSTSPSTSAASPGSSRRSSARWPSSTGTHWTRSSRGGRSRADELRVLQVARALVDNALVHTPGTVVVIRARADREHAYLAVEDDGPGVAVEDAPHVFERFYRAEGGVASGSGLGLAIARELAMAMGGSVELESEPGRTIVRVVLGAAPTSLPAAGEPERVFT